MPFKASTENIKNSSVTTDDANTTTASDFQEDPFKNYRYEDPFLIEDPFNNDENGNQKTAEPGKCLISIAIHSFNVQILFSILYNYSCK